MQLLEENQKLKHRNENLIKSIEILQLQVGMALVMQTLLVPRAIKRLWVARNGVTCLNAMKLQEKRLCNICTTLPEKPKMEIQAFPLSRMLLRA